MSNGSNTFFMPYGSVNITFRYGDLRTIQRNGSEAASTSALMLSIAPSPPPSPVPEEHSLSPRQWEVLRLLVQGRSNKEIARTLGLAIGTVKIHVAVLFHKLGVTGRTAAAVVGARLLAQQDQSRTSRSGDPTSQTTYPFGPSHHALAA
jgi:DNA-binding CsgD family transcriptional regulator